MLTNVISGLLCCQMQWTFSVIFFSLSTSQPSEADDCQLFPLLISPLGWFFLLYLHSQ